MLLASGDLQLAAGNWLLAKWPLAAGNWLLENCKY